MATQLEFSHHNHDFLLSLLLVIFVNVADKTGECEANPSFMLLNCAPACQTCDFISFETRCPFDDYDAGAWQPGDLDAMFQRITVEYAETVTVLSGDPWIIQLDDFLTSDECQTLIELGGIQGYQRSEDVGELNFDGTQTSVQSEGRTSENAWCEKECFTHPTTGRVLKKIETLTTIPDANGEHLQLLRYKEGQFYERHHDYIELDMERPAGVRMLTVFLYLNTVEKGGGTNFPLVKNVTVQPKMGRAVLWPSVLNDDPHKVDDRTMHQALPVKEGVKYGANAWIHQRDFKTPHEKGCT